MHSLLGLCEDRLSRGVLLLLDMQWFRRGDPDVVQEIRKRNPDILILGMTDHPPGFPGESYFRKLRIRLLHKPFSFLQLQRKITAALKVRA